MTEVAAPALWLGRDHAVPGQLAGGDPEWVRAVREAALSAYREEPWPSSSRDEDWRRTPQVDRLDPAAFAPPEGRPAELPEYLAQELAEGIPGLGSAATLITDETGNLRAPDGPEQALARPLEEALREEPAIWQEVLGKLANPGMRKFVALNTIRFQAGACVRVPRGRRLEAPVRLVHGVSGGSASFPRTLILMEEGSSLDLVEEWVSPSGEADLMAPVVEVLMRPGSTLNHVIVQSCGDQTVVQSSVRMRGPQAVRYRLRWAFLGSAWGKSYADIDIGGEGSEFIATGLGILNGQQHIDLQTLQDHVAGGAVSDLLYRVAVADRAHSVFTGLIRVEKDSQKTNSYVHNRNLLLSPTARADSIPTLEILANDVRCTHGSTAGRINEEQLFYCATRGIPRVDARRLVVEAFFGDVIDGFPEGPLREAARAAVLRSLVRLSDALDSYDGKD